MVNLTIEINQGKMEEKDVFPVPTIRVKSFIDVDSRRFMNKSYNSFYILQFLVCILCHRDFILYSLKTAIFIST